jgi:hypothetical protein
VVAAGSSRQEKGYDFSDVPIGLHVEASHKDDAKGRRWTLSVLSAVPQQAVASIRLLDDASRPAAGRAPFVDEGGHYVGAATLSGGVGSVYMPFGAAVYTEPKTMSLEVVAHDKKGRPLGKAILDAELPAPSTFDPEGYLAPLLSLCGHIVGNDDRHVRRVLSEELGIELTGKTSSRQGDIEGAARQLVFRSPGVTRDDHEALLRNACFGEREPSTSELEALARVLAAIEKEQS